MTRCRYVSVNELVTEDKVSKVSFTSLQPMALRAQNHRDSREVNKYHDMD